MVDKVSTGNIRRSPGILQCVAVFAAMMFLLSGCVTYKESPFTRSANEMKAEENYVQLGLAYIRKDRPDRAREHLERALEINPRSAPATAAMGLVMQLQGEPALAEGKFREALEMDAGYTRGRTFYGAFLYNQGRFQDAYDQFKAASLDTDYPDRDQIFINLAQCAMALDRTGEAAAAYRRALDVAPSSARALRGLTTVLVEQGEFKQARRYYERLATIIRRSESVAHTPETIMAGIRIARYFNNADQEASLALLLRNLYPQSEELKQYKALKANE